MSDLEKNVLQKAQEHLDRLQELVNDDSGEVGPFDINSCSDYLFSLCDLAEIEEHGMSEESWRNLSQINVRALYLLRNKRG